VGESMVVARIAGKELHMRRGVGIGGTVLAVMAVGALLARRWQMQWGATHDEAGATFPGDVLLAGADVVATRAIAIAAEPAMVWPWIAQLGQGRGGFYSYDFLENLVGCDVHSADRIVPEWQQIHVGDQFMLHPEVAMTVAAVRSGRSLVVRGGVPMGEVAAPYDFTWAFIVLGQPDGTTRLAVRERYSYTREWGRLLVEPVQVVSFVMSRKMMRGIKSRAERSPREDHQRDRATSSPAGGREP
jgi:hypothetical protein